MKITLPLLITISMFTCQAASAQQSSATFAAHHTTANPVASVTQINCTINNGRVLLTWNISNNEAADQFEVESSTDGKSFKMAALVFPSEKENSDDYAFFEKAKSKKTFYRLKIISKDKSTHYSAIVAP